MTAKLKWKQLAKPELNDSFWEGFRSTFDFLCVKYSAVDPISLTPPPDTLIDIRIGSGLTSDLANLNADISNLTADAKAATRKVLSKKRP